MEVILNFKDGDLEVVKNVSGIFDRGPELKIRDKELHVIRYDKSSVRNIEIVWR